VPDADVTILGKDRRTEYNPSQTLRPVSEVAPTRPAVVGGRPVKETEDDYLQWLIARDGDVTEADRELARERREALKSPAGLTTESYRRVSVAEALKRLASAGRAPEAMSSRDVA